MGTTWHHWDLLWYVLKPGGAWADQYMVWNLADFTRTNLASDALAPTDGKYAKPNRVRTVKISTDGPVFPLRAEYVRKNQRKAVERQIANYRKFRELTQEWVDLAIELCKLKAKHTEEK